MNPIHQPRNRAERRMARYRPDLWIRRTSPTRPAWHRFVAS